MRWSLGSGGAAILARPCFDVGALPHLAHVEHDLGCGEVVAGDQLLNPLSAEATEHAADLGGAHEVMHGSNHRLDATRHLTSGQEYGRLVT